MSIVGKYNETTRSIEPLSIRIKEQMGEKADPVSGYRPSDEEKQVRDMVLKHFTLGYLNMYTPRQEFNDLAVIQRAMVDQMAFNTYQANNGQPYEGDSQSWHSRALRPIVRNQCISIAAHATARLIFPHIVAHNESSEVQKEAAQVMSDLLEYIGEQADYTMVALYAVLSALVNPASFVHVEYNEVERTVKREQNADGSYREETIIDDVLSGFKAQVVSPDELFIENFFEPNIQKQNWLIWRQVISYETAKAMFGDDPNFQYVSPGMQILYNDANATFYQVYDYNMRPYMCELVTYWNRRLDLKIRMLNGVMIGRYDNPNPRNDKRYPFTKFGFEPINNRCFYYKSTAFKLMQDANIINTLYPMIIDRTYLNLFPAYAVIGDELEDQNVVVPGKVTTLSNPNSKLQALESGIDIKVGLEALGKVEESINTSGQQPVSPQNAGAATAYEISKREQERNTVLGLFVNMVGSFVKQLGTLWVGDALQYLTIADAQKITDNPELIFKTFVVPKKIDGKNKVRHIVFDNSLPDKMGKQEVLNTSYDILERQGGLTSDTELALVNPEVFRNLKFQTLVNPDVMNPLSDDVERAYNLEVYDRGVQNPIANQESIWELILQTTPTTRRDPKKYIQQQQQPGMPAAQPMPSMLNMAGQQLPQPAEMPKFNESMFGTKSPVVPQPQNKYNLGQQAMNR